MELRNNGNYDSLSFMVKGLSGDQLQLALAEYVVSVAARHFGNHPKEEVKGSGRHIREHVYARCAVYHILKVEIPKIIDLEIHYTLNYMTKFFCKKNHSSAIHGIKTHNNLFDTKDKGYYPIYNAVLEEVTNCIRESVIMESLEAKLQFIDNTIADLTKTRAEVMSKIEKIKSEVNQ